MSNSIVTPMRPQPSPASSTGSSARVIRLYYSCAVLRSPTWISSCLSWGISGRAMSYLIGLTKKTRTRSPSTTFTSWSRRCYLRHMPSCPVTIKKETPHQQWLSSLPARMSRKTDGSRWWSFGPQTTLQGRTGSKSASSDIISTQWK